MAAKEKSVADQYFPVSTIPKLNQPMKPRENPKAIKKIIQGAIQGAFKIKTPCSYDLKYGNLPNTLVTEDQVRFVTYLIESLQPADAIEAALASQFAISYIRGLQISSEGCISTELFEFGHKVLEAMQKYRSKGAQQISVQYNVNQSQILNVKNVKAAEKSVILEGGEV